jgi:hypothetical protein
MTARQTGALAILYEVSAERQRQDQKWGEQNHPDGTGPEEHLLGMRCYDTMAFDYADIADRCKEATDANAAEGTVTFADILLEEVFEALAEADPAKVRKELVQVAAVAVQWVQKIDRDRKRSA